MSPQCIGSLASDAAAPHAGVTRGRTMEFLGDPVSNEAAPQADVAQVLLKLAQARQFA